MMHGPANIKLLLLFAHILVCRLYMVIIFSEEPAARIFSGIKAFPLKIKKPSSSKREKALPKLRYPHYDTSQMAVSYICENNKYLTSCMYLVAWGIHFFIDNYFITNKGTELVNKSLSIVSHMRDCVFVEISAAPFLLI